MLTGCGVVSVFPRPLPPSVSVATLGPGSELQTSHPELFRQFFFRAPCDYPDHPPETLALSALPPPCSIVHLLRGPFEVKRSWMHSELFSSNAFAGGGFARNITTYIDPFPEGHLPSSALDPEVIARITTCFENNRGGSKHLWGLTREHANWALVENTKWPLEWMQQNVRVLYPKEDQFPIDEICPVIVWKNPKVEAYQLIDGNHRVSEWYRKESPFMPIAMFIGRSPVRPTFPVDEIDGPR